MSKIEAKKIIKNCADVLKKKKYPFKAIYLFGSYAKGGASKWSDIDIAVVSDKLRINYERNRAMLRNICLDIDNRLELHGFSERDFKDNADPLAYEIRKTGIKIA